MANEMLHAVLGYEYGELIGKTIFDIYPKHSHKKAEAGIKQIFEKGYHKIVTASMIDKNKEEIEVEYKGKDLKIGFNARYVLDVLASMHDDVVRIELNDQLSPGLVRPHEDTSYTCVVMPMRI